MSEIVTVTVVMGKGWGFTHLNPPHPRTQISPFFPYAQSENF